MHQPLIRSALIGLTLLAAACGAGGATDTTEAVAPGDGAAGGTCPVGTPNCVDADLGGTPDTAPEGFAVDRAREQARSLLGTAEGELPDDVRIGRRGDEHMALIEDYRLGRMTVDLDDDGSGFRASAVTVELPDGPETVHLG